MKRLNQIAIFIFMLALTACATTPTPAATATPTPLPLPSTLVETVPQMGSELGPKATLLVLFSGKMDRASVEAALTSDVAGGVLLNWVDDVTLAITPKAAYPADGQVTFMLAASAKDANGLALPEVFGKRGLQSGIQVIHKPGRAARQQRACSTAHAKRKTPHI